MWLTTAVHSFIHPLMFDLIRWGHLHYSPARLTFHSAQLRLGPGCCTGAIYTMAWARCALGWTWAALGMDCCIGAIYTMAWAGPAHGSGWGQAGDFGLFTLRPGQDLCSAQLSSGRAWVAYLHLLCEPGSNQQFHIIIAANVLSVYYTFRLKLFVPDSS